MSFIDRIEESNVHDLSRYRPFRVDGTELGAIGEDFAERLSEFTDVFRVSAAAVELAGGLDGFEKRTAAVDRVLRDLAERGAVPNWRDEAYPVGTSFAAPALFNMDRAAASLFGIEAYGVHLNGVVKGGNGFEMWIGRRAMSKLTAPGKLDQMVAGGQPAGLSLLDNLVKEGAEEASLPPALAARAVPAGEVSYCIERPEGLRRDVLFLYDLEVPADFEPVNTDGEISEFYLWPLARVIETVRDTDDFKFNCSLVVIDFLIRHGFIGPEHPEYEALRKGLRR